MSKLFKPAKNVVIEQTALQLAATWWEVGRSQGMTSKYKSARAYARANMEKFVPKSVEYLLQMLGRSDIHDLQKAEIYAALIERANDPTLNEAGVLPKIDVSKLIPVREKPSVIHIRQNANPFLKAN